MSPWWVIHSSALKASPLPEPTSAAASRAQLHITSSSFSCSNPIRFALMQDKSCTKLLRNRPLRLFPATPRLFETLHQDLPVLLFPCAPILSFLPPPRWRRFLQHPATHPELLGGGSSHCSPQFPPSTFSARLQHGKSSPVAAVAAGRQQQLLYLQEKSANSLLKWRICSPCLNASVSYNNIISLIFIIIIIKSKDDVTSPLPHYLSLHSILVLQAPLTPPLQTASATAEGSWELFLGCLS